MDLKIATALNLSPELVWFSRQSYADELTCQTTDRVCSAKIGRVTTGDTSPIQNQYKTKYMYSVLEQILQFLNKSYTGTLTCLGWFCIGFVKFGTIPTYYTVNNL
jgi:hypothetical protein